MNRKREIFTIGEAYKNVFYGTMPIKVTIMQASHDAQDQSTMYHVRLENKDTHPKMYQSLRKQYAEIQVVEYQDKDRGRDGFSFKDLVDSRYLGAHEDAYRTAFRWYNIHEKEIVDTIKKEKAIQSMRPKSREHFEDLIRNLDESSNRDAYIFFLRVMKVRRGQSYSSEKAFYKYKKVSDMTQDEKRLFKMMQRYGAGQGSRDIKSYELLNYSDDNIKYHLAFIVPNEQKAKDLVKVYKGTFKQFEEELYMKPETKKHFGDIMNALNESANKHNPFIIEQKKDQQNEYVLIIKSKYKNLDDMVGTHYYTLCAVKELNQYNKNLLDFLLQKKGGNMFRRDKDNNLHNITVRSASYLNNFQDVYAYVGSEDIIREELEKWKSIYLPKNGDRHMIEEPNFKPETKKHFGDIMSALSENKLHAL